MVVDKASGEENELVGKKLDDPILLYKEAPNVRKNIG